MDPNETLRRMQEMAERVVRAADVGSDVDEDDACDLADAVQALDGWLSKGGFLPDAWRAKP